MEVEHKHTSFYILRNKNIFVISKSDKVQKLGEKLDLT